MPLRMTGKRNASQNDGKKKCLSGWQEKKEILRYAQDDKKGAQDDGKGAQDDKKGAQDDGKGRFAAGKTKILSI